ncbi:MAG: TonB-dependent receptor plug domain-containing protein [Ferrovibrionaceae bacterium]
MKTRILAACALALAPETVWAQAEVQRVAEPQRLDEIVVTASGRPEPLSQVASTIQVITEDRIRNSSAQSVAGILAENAVGFFNEWSTAQTAFNIRGGATDGQGRDFRSQVLVLMNGRRAGTANLQKLSPWDVSRIEIVRGPASVVYGSQAMGGVINIITRNGQNTAGSSLMGQTGSWSLAQAVGSTAGKADGVDWYAGANDGRRGDMSSPSAKETNTGWSRHGGLAALGVQLGQNNRVDVTARSDGIYDAGFRGSQWDYNNKDTRYNQSIEMVWSGTTPSGWFNWSAQGYAFNDVDDFHWGSERLRTGAPGYRWDHNRRDLQAVGVRLLPEFHPTRTTDILFGLDAEQAKLRSTRLRIAMPGAANTQVAPFDNNENNDSLGLYGEGVQRLLDDRLTLRGGLRWSYGRQSLEATPYQPLLIANTQTYNKVTYSAGAAYQALSWLKLRGGVASGFRAPTGSELGADFTAVGGSQTLGNPNLKPESNVQQEIGATAAIDTAFVDLALFQNRISDRITTRALTSTRSQYVNASGDLTVRGLELQSEWDAARQFGLTGSTLRLFGNASWNFDMTDDGWDRSATGPYRTRPQRMYEYQAAIGGVVGLREVFDLWVFNILRGPVYYDTEEALLIPQGEPSDRYVHRKGAFWITNLRLNTYPTKGVTLFGAINNLFDVNDHPLYIATDKQPYVSNPVSSNGGRGNSLGGREFIVGLQVKF